MFERYDISHIFIHFSKYWFIVDKVHWTETNFLFRFQSFYFVILAGKWCSSCRVPKRVASTEFPKRLRWYNTKVHLAAFVLPQFIERKLETLRPPQYFEDGDEDDVNKEAYEENVEEWRDRFLDCTFFNNYCFVFVVLFFEGVNPTFTLGLPGMFDN